MSLEQQLSLRERDLNTPGQLFAAMGFSALAHAAALLIILFAPALVFKPKTYMTGYSVNLVSIPSAGTSPGPPPPPQAEKAEEPAAEIPVKKATAFKKEVASEPEVKTKKAPAAKKIVPKQEEKPKEKEDKKEEKAAADAPRKIKESREGVPGGRVGASFDAGGGGQFPYVWYGGVVERKINENWITHGISITGKRVNPTVKFTILKDGTISGVTLERSSGNTQMDESAVAAVSRAGPFPALPPGYSGDSLTVHFTFIYEVRD